MEKKSNGDGMHKTGAGVQKVPLTEGIQKGQNFNNQNPPAKPSPPPPLNPTSNPPPKNGG